MLQNFSQTQGTVFHSSACISSSEGFFKNRSAHFCGKSPSSGACPSQIAILLSLGLKFLMKWKPTYIYGDLNFSDSQQVFANLFSWRKLEGSLIISWKFQGHTPQEIWITAFFPARSKVVSYDVLHHTLVQRWHLVDTLRASVQSRSLLTVPCHCSFTQPNTCIHWFTDRNTRGCGHSPFSMRTSSWMACARSCQPIAYLTLLVRKVFHSKLTAWKIWLPRKSTRVETERG